MNKINRIKELVNILNEAAKVYYSGTDEIMSNYEYDRLYDELVALEKETDMILSDSPTIRVGYETLSELEKEAHESPMLSLDKTKSVETLADFAGEHTSVLSWKLDGLTIVLTYNKGELVKAVTRGNGYVGEAVTQNAKVFKNLPLKIPFEGELVLRGEAIITYSDFDKINETIENADEKYKNPRNLCSGSVRQLNNEITAQRNVQFVAFALIKANGVEFENSRKKQFEWLSSQGFTVVEYTMVNSENMSENVEEFSKKVKTNDFPSDGLVLLYDDIVYGESLGTTAKFPRNAIAFKWADETAVTTLIDVEWSASRTGLINPVAIFESVELEGTTVSRASVHNVSIVKELKLGIGDSITVYKANMIIPQIGENLTGSDTLVIPEVCPVCGGKTEIVTSAGASSLYCMNQECQAKQIKKFVHFVNRNALNIDGISEQTLEKFIEKGFIKKYKDMYHLDRYEQEIIEMEGFGKKSYEKIISSVNESRNTTLAKTIFGWGIAGIGFANAKLICTHFNDDIDSIINITEEQLVEIDGIGEVLAKAFADYFHNDENKNDFTELLSELSLKKEVRNTESAIVGKNFVVTGSVTSKTDYLINNDTTSNSSKNKKAKELNVPIISEEEFLILIGRNE